jgi:hypothetical protein
MLYKSDNRNSRLILCTRLAMKAIVAGFVFAVFAQSMLVAQDIPTMPPPQAIATRHSVSLR